MSKKRQNHSDVFKGKVALEAVRNDRTLSQISSEYKINVNLVSKWKTQLVSNVCEVFRKGIAKSESSDKELICELYQQIGEMKVQLDWLKKKSNYFG